MIHAVAFDIDGTLVDLWSAIDGGLTAVLDVLREVSPAAAGLTVDDLHADCEALYLQAPLTPIHDIRRAGLARSMAAVGVDDPAVYERLCEVFFDRRYRMLRVFDDVLPTLAALRSEYKIGVGSNGNSHTYRCGLYGEFAFEVYAHVDGVPPKPTPGFFQRLLAEAGVEPEEAVYVGDEPENDIAAAQRAGLRAVWVNRSRRKVPEGLLPDGIVTTLIDLPAALATLG